ncbi:hypothetical protein [Nonomuraea recticatena]|uniref:hypothetical protein n=1 Tax=Nonomuraea recticatena TaxID=46178 RepID=UPI0036227C04
MTHPTNRRRLRHRIPVKLRHNWKLVALCTAFLAVCWGVFGSGTIRPYVTTAQTASADTVATNLTGTKDLFDTTVAHEVKLTFTDAAYRDMLTEYYASGEKRYVEADLTIDGTRIPSVGVRLKGNSTLAGLTWNGKSRSRGGIPRGGPPEGFEPPEGFQPPEGFSRLAASSPRETDSRRRMDSRKRTGGPAAGCSALSSRRRSPRSCPG